MGKRSSMRANKIEEQVVAHSASVALERTVFKLSDDSQSSSKGVKLNIKPTTTASLKK